MKTINPTLLLMFVLWPWLTSAGEIKAIITPEKPRFVEHEPIVLRCVFVNETEDSASFDLGRNDAEGVVVLLKDHDKTTRLPYTLRRGGGDFSTKQTLRPHQRITRYLVLDQWFRPPSVGTYDLEFTTTSEKAPIKGAFKVIVDKFDESHITSDVDAMIQQFQKLRSEPHSIETGELRSYKTALLLVLSYIATDAPHSLHDIEQKYSADAYLMELVGAAKTMGPGGGRQLD